MSSRAHPPVTPPPRSPGGSATEGFAVEPELRALARAGLVVPGELAEALAPLTDGEPSEEAIRTTGEEGMHAMR